MPYTADEFRERRLKREEEIKKKTQETDRRFNFFSTLMIICVILVFWLFVDMSATTFVILLVLFALFRIENHLEKLVAFIKINKDI